MQMSFGIRLYDAMNLAIRMEVPTRLLRLSGRLSWVSTRLLEYHCRTAEINPYPDQTAKSSRAIVVLPDDSSVYHPELVSKWLAKHPLLNRTG
jgi:hypothetical protein